MGMNPESSMYVRTFGGSVRKTDIGFPGTVSSAIFLSLASETLSTQISSS